MKSFSLWLDYLDKDFLHNELKDFIKTYKINGITTNPSIFKAYIAKQKNLKKSQDPKKTYEDLAFSDVGFACDVFASLGVPNSLVSLEVDPFLAHDETATIKEALRINAAINRPNLAIKIPATKAGINAAKTLLKEGLNINATLVFDRYQTSDLLESFESANAKQRLVISVFVSRFDKILGNLDSFTNKLGIYNATASYNLIKELNNPLVQVVFASTGTKDDSLPKSYYLDELLFEDAINTAPMDAIKAFRAKSQFKKTPKTNKEINDFFAKLSQKADFAKICDNLKQNAIKDFEQSFQEILNLLKGD